MVIDASVAIAWFLPDERNPAADVLLRDLAGATALVPSIFWHEVRNAFLMAERRGRLRPGEAQSCISDLRSLVLKDGGHGDDRTVLSLAIKHSLTAYDAAYLALAVAQALPLATLDRRLAGAAQTENIALRVVLDERP